MSPSPYHWVHVEMPLVLLPLQQVLVPIWVLRVGVSLPAFPFREPLVGGPVATVPRCTGRKGILSQAGL